MPVHGFRFSFTPLAGVLFTFPSRYSFAIGSCSVFSLGSWSTRIRAGFLVPRPTQDTARRLRLSRTRLSRSSAGLPMPFRLPRLLTLAVLQPRSWRFGLLRFRSPLLTESLLISFPGLLRWFTSPSVAPHAYFIRRPRCGDRSPRVTPFGHPRINGHVHLPGASRSLSRPSSPGSSLGIRHGPMFAWPYPPSRRTMAALGGYGYLLHRGTDSPVPPSSFFPSLVPVKDHLFFMENRGFEPLTLGLQSRCSSQLS